MGEYIKAKCPYWHKEAGQEMTVFKPKNGDWMFRAVMGHQGIEF